MSAWSRRPVVARLAVVTVTCILAELTGGCRAESSAPRAPAAVTRRLPDGRMLLPVSLPDLSQMEQAAQRQLGERYSSLARTVENPKATAAELGNAYGEMGKLLMAAEYLDAAEPCFLNAHTLVPGDMRWLYYSGHLHKQRGDLAQAAAFFEKTLQVQPGDIATLAWLGNVYLDQNRPADAALRFEQVLARDPRSITALIGLGRVALANGDDRLAVTYLERALSVEPGSSSAHFPLATAYRRLGQRAKSDAHLQQRGNVGADPPDVLMTELQGLLETVQGYRSRGIRAYFEQEWSEAAAQFRRGVELAPEDPTMRLNLGTALVRAGDAEGALTQFEEALRLSPGSAKAHYSLGLVLEMVGRNEAAIQQFSAAVRSESTFLAAYLSLAEALRRSGRVEESLPYYAHVTTANPDVADASFGHAIALVRLGRYQQARDILTEGTRRHADQTRFVHALARLLAAAPDDQVRDGRRAMTIMETLLKGPATLAMAETTAMTLAELGRYGEAVAWQRETLAAARKAGEGEWQIRRLAENLQRFERREPCRVPWSDDDPIHRPPPPAPDLALP